MADSESTAILREIADQKSSIPQRTPPSRLLWFVIGGTFSAAACMLLYSIGLRVPPIGFGVAVAPGLGAVQLGMNYEQVVRAMGPEDGALRAAEFVSAEESYCSYCSEIDFRAFEADGGRFLFWLSRSNGLLVFNVVAFDKNDAVRHVSVLEETYFGMD